MEQSNVGIDEADLGHSLFLNRTAIVDGERRIKAYEFDFLTATLDTPPLLTILGLKRTLQRLCGGKKIFIKADLDALEVLRGNAAPDEMVFEVPAGQIESRNGLDALKAGAERYGRLCLTELVMSDRIKPVLRHPCFIKLETAGLGEGELRRMVFGLKGFPVVTIGASVRTRGQFEACRNAGFELFEGEFVTEPSPAAKRSISPSHGLLLELSRHTSRDTDIQVVEEIFKKNPDLAFGLFNLVHSAFFRVTENVTSIRQAIALLGYENLHKWVALMLFTIDHSDPSSNVLFEKALTRARTMEVAAKRIGRKELSDEAYMTGIFSLVHLLFDVPFQEIMTKVNFSEEIQDALVTRKGTLGQLLDAAEKLERGEYAACRPYADALGLELTDLLRAQTSAIVEQQASAGDPGPDTAARDQQQAVGRETNDHQWLHDSAELSVRPSWFTRLFGFLGL